MLTTIWSICCAGGLVLLAGRLGALLLRTPLRPNSPLEGALLSAGLGLGLLTYLPMLLGAFGLLTPAVVRLALLLLILLVLLLPPRPALSHLLSRKQRSTPAPSPFRHGGRERWKGILPSLWFGIVVGVGGFFLLSAFCSCLTPMVDVDGLAYHVGAPKRWLELGSLRYLPTHLHTQWPMGTEMLFTLLLPLADNLACKPLTALFALMTALAVCALGLRLASALVGLTAGALVILRAGAPSINTTSVEIELAFFTLLSALALAGWTEAEENREHRAWLVLAALYAGFACCTKLNGLLLLVFLTLAVLILPRRSPPSPRIRGDERGGVHGRPLAARLADAVLFCGLALLCASPWYLRVWVNTGDPLFPFGYRLFKGDYWSAQASANLVAYFRSFDLPGDTLAERRAFVVRHLWKLLVLTIVGVLLPGPRWARGFALGAGLFAMAQVSVSDNPRFLLPAAPFAALVIAWWVARGAARWPLVGWTFAIWLACSYIPAGAREGWHRLPVSLGLRSREAFIRSYVNNYDAFLWANRHLPPDAKVLYGPDNRTYYLQREVYWSVELYQRRIVYDTPEVFAASLRREGITHLILNRDVYKDHAISFETRMGWRRNEKIRLEELAARSERLWEGKGVTVYRIR